ncbi:hypothetical protein Hamer_G009721, partial [Homarus americanus]
MSDFQARLGGRESSIIIHADCIRALIAKPKLWEKRIPDGNATSPLPPALHNYWYVALSKIWIKMRSHSPNLSNNALPVLISYTSTYLCESNFSSLL